MSKPLKSEKRPPQVHNVRCLGPGPEHRFLSRDPVNNRICERCRDKVREIGGREVTMRAGE